MYTCFSDQVPLRKVLQAAKHHLRHSSSNSEKQQWCNWQKNKESNATNGNMIVSVIACSYLWGRDKGEFSLVGTWGWQCSDWGTWCFVPMKNTILALRTKLQASVGKEQLQLTVFTARYLLGQVEASSV